MKRIMKILLLAGLLAIVLVLAGCSGSRLTRPVGVCVDIGTEMLLWNRVNGAELYTVQINDEAPITTRTTQYSLRSLPVGTYTIRVRAEDVNGVYEASDWSIKASYVKDENYGVEYTLSADRSHYYVSGVGTAKGDIRILGSYNGLPVKYIARRAFANCSVITSVTIDEGVQSIGEYAFYGCTALTSIQLPQSLTSIEAHAFHSCRELTQVTIPAAVHTLSAYAFAYCRALTDVTVQGDIQAVQEYAFAECQSIEKLLFTGRVLQIEQYAFANCNSLPDIDLGATGLLTLGNDAFTKCASLASVILPSTLESIGNGAFQECTALTEISIPGNVTAVGDTAFQDCSGLASVRIGDSVRSIGISAFAGTAIPAGEGSVVYVGKWAIGFQDPEQMVNAAGELLLREDTVGIADGAFQNDTVIESLKLPDAVKYVGKYAFASGEKLLVVSLGRNLEVIDQGAFAECKMLLQLSTGKSRQLKTIGDMAFYGCELLEKSESKEVVLKLPATVESIGGFAFMGCTNLKDVDLPDALNHIGTYAFQQTGLTANAAGFIYADNWVVGLESENTIIGEFDSDTAGIADYAFMSYQGTTIISLPDGLRYIGKAAFVGSGIMILTIPGSVKEIGEYAFYKCQFLTNVQIKYGVEKIGKCAFYSCDMLGTLQLPDSLKEIGEGAFAGSGIMRIVIPDSVETMGTGAFYSCLGLSSVTVGSGLKTIADRAFANCERLYELTIREGVETIGTRAFLACTKLSTIALPDSLKTVGEGAFLKCSVLSHVDLGDGVETIGKQAFYDCTALSSITIPDSVVRIETEAFWNCTALSQVILPQWVETIGDHAFSQTNPLLVIYMEAEQMPESWQNTLWNSGNKPVMFGAIVSDDGSYIAGLNGIDSRYWQIGMQPGVLYRDGYSFVGWSTVPDAPEAEYTSAALNTAPEGVTVYTVWESRWESPETENDSTNGGE